MASRKRAAAKGGSASRILGEIAAAFTRLGEALEGGSKAVVAAVAKAPAKRGRKRGRPAGKRGPGRPRKAAPAAAAKAGRPKKKNPNLQLQGQYMAAIRSLSLPKKNQVRAVRAAKGVEAAISLAKKLRK